LTTCIHERILPTGWVPTPIEILIISFESEIPMSAASKQQVEVKLEINPPGGHGACPMTITGAPVDLHNDPQKIHQLLDLLNMPKGTEVKVLTTASSSIVR
jgi:hypothetical protein